MFKLALRDCSKNFSKIEKTMLCTSHYKCKAKKGCAEMKPYKTPQVEKIEFDYIQNVVASSIIISHGDMGIGLGHGGGCDHDPGHGNPHKPHP